MNPWEFVKTHIPVPYPRVGPKVVPFFFKFIYLSERERERERERTSRGGRGRGRGRERILSGLHAISTEPDAGPKLINREIMT